MDGGQRSRPVWLGLTFLLLGGVLLGEEADAETAWRVAPLLVLVLLAAVVVHELGHLAAFRLVGFRVNHWQILALAGAATAGGWRLRLAWQQPLRGLVVGVPDRPDRLRWRHAVGIAGGPAAHALLAAALAAAGAAGAGPGCWLGAALVGLTAAANLTPTTGRGGAFWTDGMWLWRWLTGPDRAVQWLALTVLFLAQAGGRRPREWDERWVALATAVPARPTSPQEVRGALAGYRWAADRGDVAAAEAWLDRAAAGRDRLDPRLRPEVTIEQAFVAARHRRDAAAAARLLAGGVRPHPALLQARARALAAAHLAAGRPEEALAVCERLLGAAPAPGAEVGPGELTAFEREQVEAVRADALAALSRPPARSA